LYFLPPLTTLIDAASESVPPPTPVSRPPSTGPSTGPVGLSSDSGFTGWPKPLDELEDAVWLDEEF
jgi:hypothetical protein